MEDDDLYPGDPSYFRPQEPPDQTIARKKEKAKVLEGLTVLKEVIARLQGRIEFYNSLDSIPPAVKDDPEKFMHWHSANCLVRDNLKEEKEYIESLLDTYAPNL